jgi:hypothetical protein
MSVEINITDQIVEIEVAAGAIIAPVWGGITGTLSNQTDLQTALDAKFDDPTGTTAQYLRGDGTLATFPSLTGFVPYTGATANVDLGVYTILAQNATIASSGSGDTATINHSSGSGIALNITKGGNNEGLYINKTGGSGNAATIIGTLNATTLVKSGGLSTEYLKADGSVSTLTNPITGTGTAGQVAYFTGATTQAGSNNLFWNSANNRLGINTSTPASALQVVGTVDATNVQTPLVFSSGSDLTFATQGGTSAMTIFSTTRNVLIQNAGSISDSGQRLQVTGDTLLKGSGATSATTALTVQNSAAATMMSISNDAATTILNITGSTASAFQVNQTTANRSAYFATASTVVQFGCGSAITDYQFLNNGGFGLLRLNTTPLPTTGGNLLEVPRAGAPFQPTSGTATFTTLSMQPTINQTGGANGITRGLYVNPTLTAAADWRSIEWSNNTGWGLYGAGTSNNYLGGALAIGTTSPSRGLRIGLNPTATDSAMSSVNVAVQNTVTTQYRSYLSSVGLNASGFTLPNLSHFEAIQDGSFTAGVVTNHYGFRVNAFTSGTNIFAFHSNIGAATGRWNLYMSGTAINYINASLLIGSTTDSGEKLQVTGTAKITGNVEIGGNLTLLDADNIIVGTTTGTKIGTATSQKLSLWNATPIVQPTTGIAEAAFVENLGGSIVNVDSTFDGYTMQQVVKALRNIGALA